MRRVLPEMNVVPRIGRAAVAAWLVLAGGCAQYHTPSGPRIGTALLTWTFPGDASPFEAIPPSALPPGALGTSQPIPPPAADLSGAYSGMAVNIFNPGQASDCTNLAINRSLTVSGRHVRFFAFTGTIAPDGEVVMQAGDKWISGRFVGRSFEGVLLRRFPACAWDLRLTAA